MPLSMVRRVMPVSMVRRVMPVSMVRSSNDGKEGYDVIPFHLYLLYS